MENDQNKIESFKIETTIRVKASACLVQIQLPASAHRMISQLSAQQNTGKRRHIKQI
ncbi:hypothetical protein KIV45_23445 [Janthinobacterium lividum]|nr:hypothetical protein KIV45_23445 [Janthinobacterium lividum]